MTQWIETGRENIGQKEKCIIIHSVAKQTGPIQRELMNIINIFVY
jgi:hypothetical protein